MINRFDDIGHFISSKVLETFLSDRISMIDSEIKSAVIGAPSKHKTEINFSGLIFPSETNRVFICALYSAQQEK